MRMSEYIKKKICLQCTVGVVVGEETTMGEFCCHSALTSFIKIIIKSPT